MVRRTIRMPEGLRERLEQSAKRKGISQNAFIIEACKRFVEKKSREWGEAK